MTDLFETITQADQAVMDCKRCAYKGRDVCLCSEEFANPELPQTASQAKWPFPDARREREAAERRFLDRVAEASKEVGKTEVRLAEVGTPICNANILAIDIGTTTGWALGLRDGKLHSGSESFAPRRGEGPGQRWLKFQAWLGQQYRVAGELQAIYYEKIRRHVGVESAHVYGGFEAHLQAWADRNRVRLVPAHVQHIKKSATGKGNANKDAMVAAMRQRGHRVIDDNHADALALLEYAQKQEA